MIGFEVSVNGDKKCTAGVGDKDILNVIINGPRLPNLHVGGLSGEEHVRWLPRGFDLKAGDEVTIRIVETDAVDEPIDRYVSQTRAEKEAETQERLESARQLLSEDAQFGESADFGLFETRLAEKHWSGAMEVLEFLGESSGARAEFWRILHDTAFFLSDYESCGRYREKQKAAPH